MIRIAISQAALRGDCPNAPARQRRYENKTNDAASA
jgi:hypothetical protein